MNKCIFFYIIGKVSINILCHFLHHPFYFFYRENDGDQIDVEDVYCKRVLKSAQEATYIDIHELNSTDLYDGEPSTPDHTTNSDAEVGLSHLAESERAFSEDNVHLPSPDSMIAVHVRHRDSVSESGVPAVSSVEEALADLNNMAASLPPAPPVASSAVIEIVLNDEDGEEGAVVYQETEADTSCVLDVEEDGEEEPEEGEGRSHRETDIWTTGGTQERGRGGGRPLTPRDRHLSNSTQKHSEDNA